MKIAKVWKKVWRGANVDRFDNAEAKLPKPNKENLAGTLLYSCLCYSRLYITLDHFNTLHVIFFLQITLGVFYWVLIFKTHEQLQVLATRCTNKHFQYKFKTTFKCLTEKLNWLHYSTQCNLFKYYILDSVSSEVAGKTIYSHSKFSIYKFSNSRSICPKSSRSVFRTEDGSLES